jgi:hypothetical protein
MYHIPEDENHFDLFEQYDESLADRKWTNIPTPQTNDLPDWDLPF